MEGSEPTKLAGGVGDKSKRVFCGHKHIRTLEDEIASVGLRLKDVSGRTQCTTLLAVLQYLGPRGLSTPEGTALGYMRLATRIQELEETWLIASTRERITGADGLPHNGVARYILIGKRADMQPGQLDLGLGTA
jgi:hypothetical protein